MTEERKAIIFLEGLAIMGVVNMVLGIGLGNWMIWATGALLFYLAIHK